MASNGTVSLSGTPPNEKSDFEFFFVHLQIPELMLKDDRHFLGILRAQAVRHVHAVSTCIERNVKMMVAGQALLGGIRQHTVHDAPQGLLGQKIVADLVGHDGSDLE